TLTVTVDGRNDGPVATAVTSSTNEDVAPLAVNLLGSASDVDTSDTLSVTGVTQTAARSMAFTETNATFTINQNQFNDLAVGESEQVTFSYTVADNHGTTSTSTLTVTVDGRNDGPVATAATSSTNEDAAPLAVNLLASTSDADTNNTRSITDI